MKILLGISGSSSVKLGFKLLLNLQNSQNEIFCIVTKGARLSFKAENSANIDEFYKDSFKKVAFLNDDDLSSGVSSGSFGIDKTIIAPCSISSLAKISNGLCDSLLTRACGVALKERKTLILGVREMPFSTLNLKQMTKLSKMGVIIAPPVIASYSGALNLDELENFIIGKWLDLLGIKHNLYKKWQR
ncbi:UbiX family flavin prenyltransferase [Campylobacter sp. LR291e]|uniref:UbiX family flavin prenyltransferase n=1 Tax=Campylobacter sp. LR291e TaxID=2593546 RepID=UPI0012393125|nr:UbiX family flavin prenyltransferase [Campylobacter sp. LR291e]KAA6230278.1 UbiX family flavin prenyltransferase [Campylobacter sp. LR291e]